MTLSRFKDKHKGLPVVILANGASLLKHDLSRLGIMTMTMNRSWLCVPWPDYHVCLETKHLRDFPQVYDRLAKEGKLFVAGPWPLGHCIPILSERVTKFSRDLESGVVTQIGDVGSVAYAALQVAAYMGFAPIYFLGLDLSGPHFHGQWETSKRISAQDSLFRHTPSDVKVYNVGSPESLCTAFPKLTFDQMMEAA